MIGYLLGIVSQWGVACRLVGHGWNRAIAISGACLLSVGCGTTIHVHREDPARQRQWAGAVATHAMMSLLAYHPEDVGSLKNVKVAGSLEELPFDEIDLVRQSRRQLMDEGWRVIHQYHGSENDASEGLQFTVWDRHELGKREVVFAFRGTDFKEGADWKSNFRWFAPARFFRKGDWDQYHVVNRLVLDELAKIRNQEGGDSVVISSTGHSLGGGLAQHAYYAGLPYMDRAVMFDTSPVTAFKDLDRVQQRKFHQETYRNTFPTYRILRVHEDGEILEYLRDFTGRFYRQDTLIRAVEFKVEHRGHSVNKHSMARLTRGILAQDLRARDAEKRLTEKIESQGNPEEPEPTIAPLIPAGADDGREISD